MNQFASQTDDNQKQVVKALRGIGALVYTMHQVGGGFPDLLVGWRGRWLPVEVKDGSKPPSARELTPLQRDWHERASVRKLPCLVVLSPKDAIDQVMASVDAARAIARRDGHGR